MKNKSPCRVENIVRKGEIECYKQFLIFPRFPQLYIVTLLQELNICKFAIFQEKQKTVLIFLCGLDISNFFPHA